MNYLSLKRELRVRTRMRKEGLKQVKQEVIQKRSILRVVREFTLTGMKF